MQRGKASFIWVKHVMLRYFKHVKESYQTCAIRIKIFNYKNAHNLISRGLILSWRPYFRETRKYGRQLNAGSQIRQVKYKSNKPMNQP